MRNLWCISTVLLVLLFAVTASSHERKEIDGLMVVFGGDPEPLLDQERSTLQWRFTDAGTREPATNVKDMEVTIRFDGKDFGPFKARPSYRSPGLFQTQHIFTKPGEGEATGTFKKEGEDEVLSLTVPFRVLSRETIEIP